MYLGPYIFYQYQRKKGSLKEDKWLNTCIQNAVKKKNISFFDLLLNDELPFVAIHKYHPKAALDALSLFINRHFRK